MPLQKRGIRPNDGHLEGHGGVCPPAVEKISVLQ